MDCGGLRTQQTLERTAEVTGFGFFTGVDATVRFLPAPENHGIVFKRVDLSGQPTVAANISNVLRSERRTTIVDGAAEVQLIEHIMSAMAGLQVDNVLIEIDAAEVPGCDGSCLAFCEALLNAGICRQTDPIRALTVNRTWSNNNRAASSEVSVRPHIRRLQAITYHLDYGHRSPIVPQLFSVELTPDVFFKEIAWARTFVLESEVKYLRQAGYGQRVTEKDIIVFDDDGVIGNKLRSPDECVRHKILDCIGDFALAGCEIYGHFDAWRSGHSQNHDLIHQLSEFTSQINSLQSAA